ncbi:MAG: thioredoxin domain-containing protein [Deltaproteobacteria bacterium]|nr:thioredoxin domain-containing protein [Deltaproteobacteria bacterium]
MDVTAAAIRRTGPFLLSITLVCAIGIGVAVELTRIYLLTNLDPSFESFCAVSAGVNCETVAASPYARTLGVANSLWAIFAYAWLMGMAAWGMARRGADRWPAGVIFGVSSALVAAAAVLFAIMELVIGSICILCIGLDLVNIALFVLAWALWRSAGREHGPLRLLGDDLRWIWRRPTSLAAAAVVTGGLFVGMLQYARHVERKIALAHAARGTAEDGRLRIGPDAYVQAPPGGPGHVCQGGACECRDGGAAGRGAPVQMGRDEEGHEWIGASAPKLLVQEFTDYECPFCRKAHMRLRALMSRSPGYLRTVHRNFPLDQACNPAITKPFHERACALARVAYCAGRQGRFWEMNDYLFQRAPTIRQQKTEPRDLARAPELDLEQFDCCFGPKEPDE